MFIKFIELIVYSFIGNFAPIFGLTHIFFLLFLLLLS